MVADFNRDGKLDYAQTGTEYRGLIAASSVLLGNGDGTFQQSIGASLFISVAVGDFNGDGIPDLAGTTFDAQSDYLIITLGNGNGTFSGGSSVQIPSPVSGRPIIGDLNGDGKLDVAVLGATQGLYVYLGNGDGTLQSPIISDPSTTYESLAAIGDFNRDGKLDLIAFAGYSGDGGFELYPGNGDGTFQTPPIFLGWGTGIGVADLNGDGKLDIVVVQGSSYFVSLGNGDGTFTSGSFGSIAGLQGGVTIADVNADGKLDLIFGGVNTLILPGNGDGTFQTPVQTPYSGYYSAVGDFNNDGKLDLVFALGASGSPAYVLQDVPVASTNPSMTVNLGNETIGLTGDTSLTLSNFGSGALTLTSIGLAGPNASDFALANHCGSTLVGVNASCQIEVAFAPSAAGSRSATLTVVSNGSFGSSSIVLALSGVGIAPPSLSPTTVSFPSQYVGTSGLPQTVTLTNPVGTGMLSIISVTAAPSSDFAAVSSCGNSLVNGATCSIAVFFDPSSSGTRTGTLTVTDNPSTSSPIAQTIALTGAGQDFSMSTGSSSATASPGKTATYKLTIASIGGFNQTVTFSCSGAPNLATCSVSPSSMTFSGTSSSMVSVTVTTTANAAGLLQPMATPPNSGASRFAMLLGTLGLAMLTTWLGWRRSAGRRLVPYGCAVLLLITVGSTMPGCGGSGGSHTGSEGTPAGSCSLMVTGTFNSGSTTLSHSTKLTLIVQ